MSNVSITLDDRAAQAALDRATQVARRPPTRAMADVLYNLVRQTFRAERDPWGGVWPAHSPLTLAARRRRGEASQQKLMASGDLWKSIGRSHTDTNITVTAGEGLLDPRATANQFGTSTAGRSRNVRIPARPFFPLRSATAADIPAPWWPPILAPLNRALEEAAA